MWTNIFSPACPPEAVNNCAAFCKGDFDCITACDNSPTCNPDIKPPIAGADVINSAIIAGGGVPPNANCWSPIVVTGPMNGADPGDKIFVGGGRMLGDGQLRNGEYLNMYTMQGVATAFQQANIPINTVIAKAANSTPVQGVNVVSDSTGTASGAVFNYLGANNWVPYTSVNSNAGGASFPIPGSVTTPTGITFSNLPSGFNTPTTGGSTATPGSSLALETTRKACDAAGCCSPQDAPWLGFTCSSTGCSKCKPNFPEATGGSTLASTYMPTQNPRSVQVGGTSVYALGSQQQQPWSVASSLASIMSASPAAARSYVPSPGGSFGRRFATYQ